MTGALFRTALIVLSALGAVGPLGGRAHAQEDVGAARPAHAGFGVGGMLALTGSCAFGPAAEAELYPGGFAGRLGGRFTYLGCEGFDRGMLLGGLTFEAAAARPRLTLALHLDAGVSYSDAHPLFAAGVQSSLWLLGPLALGIDTYVLFFYDGADSEFQLGSAMTLRIAR